MSEMYVVAKFQDGTVAHIALQTTIRVSGGVLHKAWDTDAEVYHELARYFGIWASDGRVMVGWRRISLDEHKMFDKNEPGQRRWYRNALTDTNGVIEYDMDKARECHRQRLRHYRSWHITEFDGAWMRAMGRGDSVEIDKAETERQRLRDLPQDPAIDACSTVDELKAHWRNLKK